MEELKIECLSGCLSRLQVLVYSPQGSLLWEIREIPTTSWLVHFTKFRSAMELWLEWNSADDTMEVIMKRDAGLFRQSYEIFAGGSLLWTIKMAGFFGVRTWKVLDRHGEIAGQVKFANPFIVGPQNGCVVNARGEVVSEIQWSSLGIFSSHPKGRVFLFSTESGDRILSVGASLIRLCAIQQR
ncbi:MAG: hypothetical protein WHS38_00810 [Thermodesulforhabdaceae bacterium]|jgi:hypothetical protein